MNRIKNILTAGFLAVVVLVLVVLPGALPFFF